MSGRAFEDCTASFNLRSVTFNCELPYLHEGDHQVALKGAEYRVVFYGNFTSADAETVLRWSPAHDDYRYFNRKSEWDAARLPREGGAE